MEASKSRIFWHDAADRDDALTAVRVGAGCWGLVVCGLASPVLSGIIEAAVAIKIVCILRMVNFP